MDLNRRIVWLYHGAEHRLHSVSRVWKDAVHDVGS
jgi:hypothetical protein